MQKPEASVASQRQYIRQRLDPFLLVQFLVGPIEQRRGFTGLSLRMIAWISLVGAPILILLQAQVTFLPYHLSWVIWLQRIAVIADLALIWFFWDRIRANDDAFFSHVQSRLWQALGAAVSLCVVLFAVSIATFSGEPLEMNSRLREWLFAGDPDEVSGRPRSVFSDRLVLIDQSFVDADRLDKVDVSHSFRGRDLRQAVFDRADLRKADFTGAMLDQARFVLSRLSAARFGCADNGTFAPAGQIPQLPVGCTSLTGANFDGAQLQDANFELASLARASFSGAHMRGATLRAANLREADFEFSESQEADFSDARLAKAYMNAANLERGNFQSADLRETTLTNANLQGAKLFANLRGANLFEADLRDADLKSASLEGTNLAEVELQGTSLEAAQLQGAYLFAAHLQGVNLENAQLQGVNLENAQLQGANLEHAQLQGASLRRAAVWRVRGIPELYLTDVDGLNLEQNHGNGPGHHLQHSASGEITLSSRSLLR